MNDLTGSGGRIDVLARAVNTALFISHGVRENSHVILHLLGGKGPVRRVWFDGSEITGVYPDERSIAGQIRSIIKKPVPPIGHYEVITDGISHSGGGLVQTVSEWRSSGIFPIVLDAVGEPQTVIPRSSSVGFVLSDDLPLSANEFEHLDGIKRVSLGDSWLQGHSCISVLHYLMDQN